MALKRTHRGLNLTEGKARSLAALSRRAGIDAWVKELDGEWIVVSPEPTTKDPQPNRREEQ